MKALISRESHRPNQRYSGVFHMQGAMVTDADLDERSVITRERMDNLGDDSIRDGVPEIGGAVAIAEDGSASLTEGVIYADGVRGVLTATEGAQLNGPLDIFAKQADLPLGPALPGNQNLVIYADIWERTVFALEDPYLADAGLHGAVTGYRSRTMTQLKAAPAGQIGAIEDGTGAFPRIGTGRLQVTPLNAEILADDCDPCADVVSAEQQVANALWRLEVIAIEGTPDNPTSVTIAWSEENAAEIAPATISEELFERTNKVYEFFSPITESRLGVYANAADARLPAFVDDLATTPTPAQDHDGQDWPFVRRWDGYAVLNTGGAAVSSTLGGGFDLSIAGMTATLRVTAFEAELDLTNAAVVPGDYWLVELRRHAPEAERVRLLQETPYGVLHHYCTLFTVNGGAIEALSDARRRKLSFPALSDLPADHVGFDNNCEKLYGEAENVQQALDNLCAISADDIAFDNNCPVLYDDATNVQEALDALCNIDFSVQDSFRLLFDWGVICGIVPRLTKQFSGLVAITPGSYLDRSGRITRFEGGEFDLNKLDFGGKGIEFENADQLNRAFAQDAVCLALASGDGGKTTIHVIPKEIAYGPADPSFSERVRACVDKKKIIGIGDLVAKLPAKQKAVAGKLFLASTADGAFRGTARLTRAEFADADTFSVALVDAFGSVATEEETVLLTERIEQARRDNPIDQASGATLEIRQMQQATAVLAAFTRTDQERLQRCICDNLFPPCPPDLGKPPYYVPIACLHGGFDPPGGFFLREVCAYCCRKQAMTWRSVQYFIGDIRTQLAAQFARICCGDEQRDPKEPGLTYDPGKYANLDLGKFTEQYKLVNTVLNRPEKLPTDYVTKVPVNDLSIKEATGALKGTGIEVVETIDIDDATAFETIEAKLIGVNPEELLISAGKVRPGDKVGLLVQDGVARGYVLLEKGSGKLPFETAKVAGLTGAELARAEELVVRTEAVKGDLEAFEKTREGLAADIESLKTEAGALQKERDAATAALEAARAQLGELTRTREALSAEIGTAVRDLQAADENRKKLVEAMRDAQPVNVVLGNDNPELVSKLAGEGITKIGDIAGLTPTVLRRLDRAGILKESEGTQLKSRAEEFLKR